MNMRQMFANPIMLGSVMTVFLAATLAIQPILEGGSATYTHSSLFVVQVGVGIAVFVAALVLENRRRA